jgi:hypothetical protein
MRSNLSPWFRNAMTAEEKAVLAEAGPDGLFVTGLARTAKGPFSVTVTRKKRAVAFAEAATPVEAIAKAIVKSLEVVE